jgi:predicted dehydrogenase
MDLNIHAPLPQRKDFRIGILGSGFIVDDCHLVAYRKAGFNPVAIASRTFERATAVAARHSIHKIYESPEELLGDSSIEVLDIAVPPAAQLPLIKAACERGTVKGILAQKPLGMNYAEALEAVNACEETGIILAVNQNMRYDQSVRAAKTLLDEGVIGEPVLATIEMRGIPHWMDWHQQLGWLTLRIMSIHHLDTFRYWFGEAESIFCSVRTDPRTKFAHRDGICTYILEYGSGLRCVGLDDTWTGPAKEGCPSDIYIRWRIEGLNGLAVGDIGWCKDPYTTPSTIRYASKGTAHFESPTWKESWFPDAFIGTMAQLLIALEEGTAPAVSGRDNLRTMALVEAAYDSAAQRRSITLKEVEEQHWSKAPDVSKRFLTPNAQQALRLARDEAARFCSMQIYTEHILLAMTQMFHCTAARVLQASGVELEAVRAQITKIYESSVTPKGPVSRAPSPWANALLKKAMAEARNLQHQQLSTGHILLAMLRYDDSRACRILRELGMSLPEATKAVLKELDPNRGN